MIKQCAQNAGKSAASLVLALVASVSMTGSLLAQQTEAPAPAATAAPIAQKSADDSVAKRLFDDQKQLWTSPLRTRKRDLKWLAPELAALGGMLASDLASQPQIAHGPHQKRFDSMTNYGAVAIGGAAASYWLLGKMHQDAHQSETGALAIEAMLNTAIIDTGLKYAIMRRRPGANGGDFFAPNSDPGFPSMHSALAWSAATVVARQSDDWRVQALAYGAATFVSIGRVKADKHYLSDVFAGALIGYNVGRSIQQRRHKPELDIGTFVKPERAPGTASIGSVYVPLDSWVYNAIDRLIAMGYVGSAFRSLRPWTRVNCAEMTREAEDRLAGDNDPMAGEIVRALHQEFTTELAQLDGEDDGGEAQLESVYTRLTGISGAPLDQSMHVGQTVINNDGRPYWEGFNNSTGFVARARNGRFSYYLNGELQHAPGQPPLSLAVRQTFASMDYESTPAPASRGADINRFRLLESYASMNLLGLDFSAGKQSLWWGPTTSGPLMMSNNAEPMWMLRINRTEPLIVPVLSRLLGPFRIDNFFGHPQGNRTPHEIYMYGQKVSFKPTENLEISFSRICTFAGEQHAPLTFGSFWSSFTSLSNVTPARKLSRQDPGARHAGFDISYRVPGLRKWVTLYGDSLIHDDVTTLTIPRNDTINPGIYISHLPRLNKLDLRLEAVSSDPPTTFFDNHMVYYESVYHDSYLNHGNLIGSWVGSRRKGYMAWSRWSFTPKSSLEFSYRNAKASHELLPGGATQNIWASKGEWALRPNLQLTANAQFEQWSAPVLAKGRKSDFLMGVTLRYEPRLKISLQ